MKKVLFGCLGVLVIAAIVGGVAGYYFVYRPARSFMAGMTQFQEVPSLNARIRNTQRFSAPPDGMLTESMVQRYVQAQRAMHDTLGARLEELDSKYEVLSKQNGGNPSFSEGVEALRDLAGIIVDAKRAQVDALNANGFSLAEYDWVRKKRVRGLRHPDVRQLRAHRRAGEQRTDTDRQQHVRGGDRRSARNKPRRWWRRTPRC